MTTAKADRYALRLRKVSKAFGGVQALNAVDFEVRAANPGRINKSTPPAPAAS